MNTIGKNELYHNLNDFLKTKGIVLTEGSYAQGIQKSCALLTDAINLGQRGLDRAKTGVDKKLDRMRQVIHEKTAPKQPGSTATAAPPCSGGSSEAQEATPVATEVAAPPPAQATAPEAKVAAKRPMARKKTKTARRGKKTEARKPKAEGNPKTES